MEIQRKELTLNFYSFLCDVIGSKKLVHKRRQILNVWEDTYGSRKLIIISSGSKAEGLDFKGSDYDIMRVDTSVKVFERLDKVSEKYSYIMDTENVKPGFTKLLVHPQQSANLSHPFVDTRTGFSYLSSKFFRQDTVDGISGIFPGMYMHGPCATSPNGSYDFVTSLRCADWISQAQPWITRLKYSWASDEVIRNIICFGILFVPIGSKRSPVTDLEWRISFSYAEKQLILCFNHVQLLCYALLKIILKDTISKSFGDLLCSYFMKTIMFWLCEETGVLFWRTENLLSCFMTCFKRLIYCVENETCFHYFIPENNLFEHRFEGKHNELLSKLKDLYDLGWTCLLRTETLKPFESYHEPLVPLNISRSTFFPCLVYLDVYPGLENWDYAKLVKRCVQNSIRSKQKADLYMFFISGLYQSFAQTSFDDVKVQGNNKVSYRHSRRSLSHLLIGVNHDAVSGWLLLASFFFTNKQYNLSKILIDHCLTKFTPDRYDLLDDNNLLTLQRYIETEKIIGRKCLKNYTIGIVKLKHSSVIIPQELKIFIENDSKMYIPSLLYAHFLNFLFYHTIPDEPAKRQSYRNIRLTGLSDYVLAAYKVHRTNICLLITDNIIHGNNHSVN